MRKSNFLDRSVETVIEALPVNRKGKLIARHILRYFGKTQLNWDPWILKDGDQYRVFYLSANNGSILRHWWDTKSTIHSAISSDMKNWKHLGVALDIEQGNEWEAGRVCAGCTYKENDVYYLFYSAANGGDRKKDLITEQIGLATSTDGIHWQRSSTQAFFKPAASNTWYGSNGNYFHWRDPYVIKDPQSGKYYMFVSAFTQKQPGIKRVGGCIGLGVADKIDGPYELLEPACFPIMEENQESIFYEVERPQVIYKQGKYHLFFSSFVSGVNSKWIDKVGAEKVSDSSLYWYVSDSITGPYMPASESPIVEGSEATGIYATNLFPDPDRPSDFIAYGWRHRVFTLEIAQQYRIHWQDDKMRITCQRPVNAKQQRLGKEAFQT